MLIVLIAAPLTGCTAEEEEKTLVFPNFSEIADDDQTYDNERMSGNAFIVIFSAEWCNNPCFTTMHAIWETQPELPVLVMSTDPAENAGGYTSGVLIDF